MFYIAAYGTFGKCYVENERGATAIRERAKLFETEQEAKEYRDKHWPLDQVTAHVRHISQ